MMMFVSNRLSDVIIYGLETLFVTACTFFFQRYSCYFIALNKRALVIFCSMFPQKRRKAFLVTLYFKAPFLVAY